MEVKTGSIPTAKFQDGQKHTQSIAFRHLPPRKDIVNQCLEFGSEAVRVTVLVFCIRFKGS